LAGRTEPWDVPCRLFLRFVFGGRDASWLQLFHVAPLLVTWLAVAALFGLAVTIAPARELVRSQSALTHRRR